MSDVGSMAAGQKRQPDAWQSAITVLQEVEPPFIPASAHAMTIVVEWPPGDPGNPFVDEEELLRRKSRRAGGSGK